MPTPSWPSTLPQKFDRDGYKETPPQITISSKMDNGDDYTRRRATTGPRPIQGKMTMTNAQVEILDSFFVNDLGSGVLKFTWVASRPGATQTTWKFNSEPVYMPARNGGIYWEVTLDLKVMP